MEPEIEHKGWRPPLADELFEARQEFDVYLKKYSRCHGLAPFLRDRSDDRSLEQVLTEFQAHSDENPARHPQLAAIKFYLQEMLWRTEERWRQGIASGTNYDAVLDEINNSFLSEHVCLVTFNYDTLLEAALQARKINIGSSISSYVNFDRFSVIRLHGSVRWARIILTSIPIPSNVPTHEGVIESARNLELGEYRIVNKPQIEEPSLGNSYLLPALAIPLENKRVFECPEDHLSFLVSKIPQIGKLLVIGWRAADSHFVNLLKEGLKPEVKTLVVSGTKEGAESVISTLTSRHQLPLSCKAFDGGFSQFVVSRGISRLLEP